MARYLRSQGVSAWQVSSQLGHKQQGMSTSEIYAPFSPDHLSEATIAIDLYLKHLACRLRVDAICDLITWLWKRIVYQWFMVELDESTTNQFFEILADWEQQLQHENINFEELGL